MLCYIGVAMAENFWTSKEGDVIGKKLMGTMLTQFGKGKDERYSYGGYKTQLELQIAYNHSKINFFTLVLKWSVEICN